MNLGRFAWILLLVPVALVQVQLDRSLGVFRAQEEVLYVWSGGQVRRMAPGFQGIMADLYWLRTIQYFGGERAYSKDKRYDLLRPLIDITTALDPRMEIAYRYGAIFLSEGHPLGAGRPNEAIALLERGAPLVGEGWRLRQQAGYFTYLFLGDARRASEILLDASKMPGAPYWLESLAGQLLMRGGERELSRQIWRQMYAQSEPGAMRDNAAAHLEQLDTLDALDAVVARVESYQRRTGSWPPSLAALQSAGLQGPLSDPCSTPFDFDPRTGKVKVSRSSPCWRPEEPMEARR